MEDLGLTIIWRADDALHRDWVRLRAVEDVMKAIEGIQSKRAMHQSFFGAGGMLQVFVDQYLAEQRAKLQFTSPQDEAAFTKLYTEAFQTKFSTLVITAFKQLMGDVFAGWSEREIGTMLGHLPNG